MNERNVEIAETAAYSAVEIQELHTFDGYFPVSWKLVNMLF